MATSNEEDGGNLTTTVTCGSNEDYTTVCVPCHRDKSTIPAYGYCTDCKEHLCHDCYQHHKKATLLKHHTLLDKDAMPATQVITDVSLQAGLNDNLTTPCPRHRTEMIKLYCHNHASLLCNICVTLDHPKPCHVDYIPDVAGFKIHEKDHEDTLDRMLTLKNVCKDIKANTRRYRKKSNDSLHNALQDVKKYRQEMNKKLDEIEKDMENEIKTLVQENGERMTNIQTICQDVLKSLKAIFVKIKQLHADKLVNKLFMEVKLAQKQLQDYESSIRSLSSEVDAIDEFKFTPSPVIKVLWTENIGTVSAKYDNIIPRCLREICVKTTTDQKTCCITGMTALPSGKLVLADNNNMSIKLVDTKSKSVISQLTLGSQSEDAPFDITSLSNSEVAATVPGRRIIQFLSVSNQVNLKHTVQTNDACVGICVHENKLLVTYRDPGKLEILDMDGNVIKAISTLSTGETLFDEPWYVQSNGINIFVSDLGDSLIITLDNQGELVKIKSIEGVRGLTKMHDGSLLVCDENNNSVHQVYGDYDKTRRVIQRVEHPYAICVDDEGHNLCIGKMTDDEKSNNILVYGI